MGIRTSSVVPVRKSRTALSSDALISGSLVCMGSLVGWDCGNGIAPGHHVSGEARSSLGGDIDGRVGSQMPDRNRSSRRGWRLWRALTSERAADIIGHPAILSTEPRPIGRFSARPARLPCPIRRQSRPDRAGDRRPVGNPASRTLDAPRDVDRQPVPSSGLPDRPDGRGQDGGRRRPGAPARGRGRRARLDDALPGDGHRHGQADRRASGAGSRIT